MTLERSFPSPRRGKMDRGGGVGWGLTGYSRRVRPVRGDRLSPPNYPPTPHDIIGMSVKFFEDPYNSDPIVTGLVCLSASCSY